MKQTTKKAINLKTCEIVNVKAKKVCNVVDENGNLILSFIGKPIMTLDEYPMPIISASRVSGLLSKTPGPLDKKILIHNVTDDGQSVLKVASCDFSVWRKLLRASLKDHFKLFLPI